MVYLAAYIYLSTLNLVKSFEYIDPHRYTCMNTNLQIYYKFSDSLTEQIEKISDDLRNFGISNAEISNYMPYDYQKCLGEQRKFSLAKKRTNTSLYKILTSAMQGVDTADMFCNINIENFRLTILKKIKEFRLLVDFSKVALDEHLKNKDKTPLENLITNFLVKLYNKTDIYLNYVSTLDSKIDVEIQIVLLLECFFYTFLYFYRSLKYLKMYMEGDSAIFIGYHNYINNIYGVDINATRKSRSESKKNIYKCLKLCNMTIEQYETRKNVNTSTRNTFEHHNENMENTCGNSYKTDRVRIYNILKFYQKYLRKKDDILRSSNFFIKNLLKSFDEFIEIRVNKEFMGFFFDNEIPGNSNRSCYDNTIKSIIEKLEKFYGENLSKMQNIIKNTSSL